MMNSKIAALFLAFGFFSVSNSYSQSESIILYNSQPVKVELTDKGQIYSFIGLVPGYMIGYDLPMSSNTKSINTTPETIMDEEPFVDVIKKNASYAIVSTEKLELDYKANFATLEKSTINKLNDIAAKLKSEPNTRVLLTAHNLSQGEKKLTSNRIASAKAYLGIKGIHPDRIKTEIQKSSVLIDVIAVNYLQ